MRFLRINNQKYFFILSQFFENLTKEKQSFTYFKKRKFSIVLNHEFTYLLFNDNDDVLGYGHIEKEGNDYWLGIVISEKYQQKGYGLLMINKLIQECITSNIYRIILSVKKNNDKAINLYKKIGFSIFRQDNKNLFLEKHL
tara:strand:- start:367 stop:789 length:423 start_codon:yes stop_codon:yes gene_type:complete